MRTYWNTDHFRQSLMVVNLATQGFNADEIKVFFYYFFDSTADHWTLTDRYQWAKLHVESFRRGSLELDEDALNT
jgi:hypothetical protein